MLDNQLKMVLRKFRGVSFLVDISRTSSKPLHRQIYEDLRARILRGDLRAGDLVPSTRELAREIGVSRLPVLNAYAQLVAEGYFETQKCAGTYVAASLPERAIPDQRRKAEVNPLRREIAAQAAALPAYERPSWAECLGPFQVGQPALQDFPIHIWSRLVARNAHRMRVSDLQYRDPMGSQTLREVLASYLRTARGVSCDSAQIMIVNGSQQGLDISTRVVLNAGAPVWVEEPGYWLVHHVLTGAGCKIIPIPVDTEGLSVPVGLKVCPKARAACVTPSHQYPLGVTLSATRRLQLLKWAEEAGSWIIEDDYDSEYRYDSAPITALQGLDADSRVIYIGTFSKVLFPSLRLGYIVIPRDLIERFTAVRQSIDLCPSHASQEVLAEFIRKGHFSRHIRKMRRLYEQRRRVLVESIKRELGDLCEVAGAEAGMHLTVLLRGSVRDTEIVARAAQQKLWLSALSLSYAAGTARQGFVLGFGNSAAVKIPSAVSLLKKLLQRAEKHGAR